MAVEVHTQPASRKVDPDRLTLGEPLVVLRVGVVRDYDGEQLTGNVTDRAQLVDMVSYFERVQQPSGQLPLIDFDHGAVGGLSLFSPVDRSVPLGAVVAMRVIDDDIGPALEVTPAYTKRGRQVIDDAEGLLWPSATYRLAPTTDRMSDDVVSDAALLAFALTPNPATRVDQLGEVRSLRAGVVLPSRHPADPTAPVARSAETQEVRVSTDEILAAIAALPDDERAMLMEALMPPPEEAPAEPEVEVELSADAPAEERADKPAADPVLEARALAAESFVADLVARGYVQPAQRSIWVRSYMADPEATKASAPTARAAYKPQGSAEKPKAGPKWKSGAEAARFARSYADKNGMTFAAATAKLCAADPEFNTLITGGAA